MSVPRPLLRPASAPLALLLAALSTVFLFGNDRGHFYRPGHHDRVYRVSAEHMAVAVNLSPAHHFLMVRHLGEVSDNPVRRFRDRASILIDRCPWLGVGA